MAVFLVCTITFITSPLTASDRVEEIIQEIYTEQNEKAEIEKYLQRLNEEGLRVNCNIYVGLGTLRSCKELIEQMVADGTIHLLLRVLAQKNISIFISGGESQIFRRGNTIYINTQTSLEMIKQYFGLTK